MASYVRQSTFADGDLITAALFNNEYNQLVSAFDNATGHKHDGTVGEGPVISVLGDAGLATPLNKILIDTTNDHIEFWVDVSGTSTQQLYIADGAIVPVTNNDVDLGTGALKFKDLYLSGTANITGNAVVTGNLTVEGTTVTLNTATLDVEDKNITLNYGAGDTSSNANGAGITIQDAVDASTDATILWNAANDRFDFSHAIDVTGSATVDGLTVNGDVSTTGYVDIPSYIRHAGDTNTFFGFPSNDDFRVYTNGNLRYRIESSGDISFYEDTGSTVKFFWDASAESLGIGTTSPNASLHITNTAPVIMLTDSDTGADSRISASSGAGSLFIDADLNNEAAFSTMSFRIDGSEAGRFDASGNLLVGQTSLDTNTVGHIFLQNGSAYHIRDGGTTGIFNRKTSDGTIVAFQKSGSDVGSIGTASGTLVVGTTNGSGSYLKFGSNVVAPVDVNGAVRDNAIDLGQTNARFKDLYLSGTANFGSLSDGTITITGFVDEDNMATNSATLVPTQQSVKAYVDSQVSSAGGNGISFEDNEKAQFGDGNDLEIFHDGSNSRIREVGTGSLLLDAESLYLRNTTGDSYLQGINGGAVNIFYDGSVKLATTSSGVNISGTVNVSEDVLLGSNGRIRVGSVGSLSSPTIYLDTDPNTGIYFPSVDSLGFVAGGTERLTVNTTGIDVTGTATMDGLTVQTAQGDIAIANSASSLNFARAGTNYIRATDAAGHFKFITGANDFATQRLNIAANGDISFYDDTGSSENLKWDASADSLRFVDNAKATFGDSNDLQIFHSSTNSHVKDAGTGSLMLQGDSLYLTNAAGGKTYFYGASSTGAAQLRYDNSPKLVTTNTGIDVTGTVTSDGLTVENSSGYGSIEIGGTSGAYLDLKAPSSDDYDLRLITTGTSGELVFPTGNFVFKRGSLQKLAVTDTGIDVTGTVTSDGLTVDGEGRIEETGAAARLVVSRTDAANAAATASVDLLEGSVGGSFGSANNYGFSIDLDGSANSLNILSGVQTSVTKRFQIGRDTGDISFYDDTGSTQGLFWDASIETLAIGHTSPSSTYRLDVSGSIRSTGTAPSYTLQESDAGNQTWLMASYGGTFAVRDTTVSGSAYPLQIQAATPSNTLYLKSDGKVGIGTSSPQDKLSIEGGDVSINNGSAFQVGGSISGNTVVGRLKNESGVLTLKGDSTRDVQFGSETNGTAMFIEGSNGNVGIGTTSPNYLLDVEGSGSLLRVNSTSGDSNIDLRVADTTSLNIINFGDSGSSNAGRILYRHSGDSMAFNVAGSEAVRIINGGNVGIGTDSPATTLDVAGSGAEIAIRDTRNISWTIGDTVASLGFYSDDASGGSGSTSNLARGAIDLVTTSTFGSTHDMVFKTRGDTTTSALERLRITSVGSVGIGTASPSAALNIVKSGLSTQFRVSNTESDATTKYGAIVGSHYTNAEEPIAGMLMTSSSSVTGGSVSIGGGISAANAVNNILFYTAANNTTLTGSERARIDSSGNFGIGTTNPTTPLHISSSDNITAQFHSTDSLSEIFISDNSSTASITNNVGILTLCADRGDTLSGSMIRFQTDTATRMIVDASGNVGIGTTSPAYSLDVQSSETTGIVAMFSNQANQTSEEALIWIAGQNKINYGVMLGAVPEVDTPSVQDHAFIVKTNDSTGTDHTERFRISSNGNVGIGTTSPSHKLDIVGGGLEITQEETTDAIALLDSTFGNTKYFSIQGDGGDANLRADAGDLILMRGGTNRLKCTSSGVVVTGALSKSSGSFKIDHPLKSDTHHLVHSFIEGPQADNLYRGVVQLEKGKAVINLDDWFNMTTGTFVALNRDIQAFVNNSETWDAVRANVQGSQLIIECQNSESNATVSWLVIGERQDKEIYESILTDDNGKIIVEPQKSLNSENKAI